MREIEHGVSLKINIFILSAQNNQNGCIKVTLGRNASPAEVLFTGNRLYYEDPLFFPCHTSNCIGNNV